MESTLLLNSSFEPLQIVTWQRAMVLFCQEKVEIIEEHDRVVRAVTFSFRLPSVVRLLKFVRIRRREQVVFSRANIYARDNYTCQYCGESFGSADLTFDHVTPAVAGGRKGWENIVSACLPCNRRKGGRTPAEAGMTLLRVPKRPHDGPIFRITIGIRNTPESWRDYLYWNARLEE